MYCGLRIFKDQLRKKKSKEERKATNHNWEPPRTTTSSARGSCEGKNIRMTLKWNYKKIHVIMTIKLIITKIMVQPLDIAMTFYTDICSDPIQHASQKRRISTSTVTRRTINSINHQKTRNLLVHTREFYKIEASKIKHHLHAHGQIETGWNQQWS